MFTSATEISLDSVPCLKYLRWFCAVICVNFIFGKCKQKNNKNIVLLTLVFIWVLNVCVLWSRLYKYTWESVKKMYMRNEIFETRQQKNVRNLATVSFTFSRFNVSLAAIYVWISNEFKQNNTKKETLHFAYWIVKIHYVHRLHQMKGLKMETFKPILYVFLHFRWKNLVGRFRSLF